MNITACLVYFEPSHELRFIGPQPDKPMIMEAYFYIRKFSLTRCRSGRLIWRGERFHTINFFLTEADAIEEIRSQGWILLKRKIGREKGYERKSYWYRDGDI